MISLKRFLVSGDSETAAHTRLVWLILEAVACHALESDPTEREAFQLSLREIVTRMEEAKNSDASLVLVGEAIKSIETYNRNVQHSLGSQMKELQSIVSLFMRSMLQLSKSSVASGVKLRQIEHQIEKCSQAGDLRTIKSQLEVSLETICEEAAEQERRSEQIGDQLRETMSRPESAAILEEAVADLDLVTGLPNFRAAEQAISKAIATGDAAYAVLLCVDRVELINNRYGFSVGDRILMLFGQHLAQRLSQTDRLFRWRGPDLLLFFDRSGPEIAIREEIARMVSVRMEQEIELGGRSVLLPIAASWTLTSLAGSSLEKISKNSTSFRSDKVAHRSASEGMIMGTPAQFDSQNFAVDLADRQLFELAPVASYVIDTNSVIREVNQELCRLLGFHREELIGHHIWEFVAIEHQQSARESIARKIARQEPDTVVEREFRCADGHYLWVEIHNKLIENAEGEVTGIGAAMVDVTQRRKVDEEIRRQHDWIKFALHSSARAIVTANALGIVGVMNPAAEKMTGWLQKEAVGRRLEQVCCIQRDSGEAVDLMSCVLEEPVTSGQLRSFTIVDRSGSAQSIKWTISPIWNDDNVIIGATLVLEP